ncbi:MAG: serine hydroxymethyltransferase [Anaplasmataceae bacterium]|nr:serine hydroxymethyltransferase [Anaplasmataceae bacterium]
MKDIKIASLVKLEIKRQNETLNLIPSENFVSNDVLFSLGSPLTNKYAEGYSAARYYGGNQVIDQIEDLAKERALKVFGLSPKNWGVNVQAYSGSPANLAVYAALVKIHETIMGLQLDMGGHLTHGHKVSFTSKAWRSTPYQLDQNTELLNYQEILKLAKKEKPRVIVAGFTAYPRQINWKKFREIADAVDAYLLVDMSHLAGLVAGKTYPSPFPYADVVTTTTHKTLRGPRSALIFTNHNSEIAKKYKVNLSKAIDKAIFPGLQGGPHANQIASVATTLFEAMQPSFKTYAKQIVKNAQTLAKELDKKKWRIVSGGTDSHLLLVDVTSRNLTGDEASAMLEKNNIIVNKNTIPYDPRPPMDPSGIRLGTPALTTRGMKEKEMKIVADLINRALARQNVKGEAVKLAKKFPLPYKNR